MIAPYNRQAWERNQTAFLVYLGKLKAHSEALRLQADEQLTSIQDATIADNSEHKALNPHLTGSDRHCKTRVTMLAPGVVRVTNTIDFKHHALGKPILWLVKPDTVRLSA